MTSVLGQTRIDTLTCPTHGEQRVTVVRFSSGDWERPRCERCRSDRAAAEERERAEIDKERRAEEARRAVVRFHEQSGIPARFRTRTLANYDASGKEQRRALEACRAYAEQFDEVVAEGRCLILAGKPGTGKTHLACGVAADVIDRHRRPVLYTSMLRAIRTVKETYSKSSEVSEQQALNALVRPDLLILDEVGVQFGSDAEKMIGFEIINARYEALKPTMLLSNLDVPALTACLGERVMDRLRENGGKLLTFAGDSFRRKP